MTSLKRQGGFGLLGLAMFAWTKTAEADPVHIILIHPKNANFLVPETLTRVRGELVADGFDVSLEETQGVADPSLADFESRSSTVAAVVGVSIDDTAKSSTGDANVGAARVWIVDRLTRKTVVRVVAMDRQSSGTPEILARRTVDLLRASLLELLLPSQQVRGAVSPTSSSQASEWAAMGITREHQSSWGVEAGVSVLAGTQGIDPALLPSVRLRLAVAPAWIARMTLAGLGTRPRVQAANGSATVAQEVGLLDVLALPYSGPIRPFLSVGLGGYHVSATGEAEWPYEGRTSSRWAFAALAGIGASFRIASQIDIAVEGQGLLLSPYPVVRFLGVDEAATGRPSLLGSVSVVGHL